MSDVYQVVDVTDWRLDEVDEQLGTKEKYWLRSPSGQRWLFKQVRSREHGEDWAEKIVERLGLHLGLPVATVELAKHEGIRGFVTRTFVPEDARLEHGTNS